MAQFDVHINRARSRRDNPLLVIVQSAKFDYLRTRLVMPLAVPTSIEVRKGNLIVEVDGRAYTMLAHGLFAVPFQALGPWKGSLSHEDMHIIRAIDDVITTAYY